MYLMFSVLCFSIQSISNEVSIKLSRKELSFLDTYNASIQGQIVGIHYCDRALDTQHILKTDSRESEDEEKKINPIFDRKLKKKKVE